MRVLAAACACALLAGAASAATSPDERKLIELRDTVINIVKALVDRGVLTRDQAEKLIEDAKIKAEAEVAANDARDKIQEEQDKGAVRVPYVPQIVKDEIGKQVVAELGPSVKQEVVEQMSSASGLRSVLPEWVQRMTWSGDVRVRGEADNFGRNNALNSYLDFLAVNSAGGAVKTGAKEFLNTTEDVDRLRLRLRFGFDTDLGAGFSAGMRLATGTGEVFATTNQTLGTYGAPYQIALDQGWVRWNDAWSAGRQLFNVTAGRFANPWVSTNMVWYNDLTFEGLSGNYRLNLSSDNTHRHDLFATIGAFPLQSEIPSSQDKWLVGAQLGADVQTDHDSHFRFGAAYYDYIHTVGARNAPDSTLLNFTAPTLLQKGNTLYDISNTTDQTVNLFALAADYRIVDLIAIADWRVFDGYAVNLTGDAVKNIGYSSANILARTGAYIAPRTAGYEAAIGFGSWPFGRSGSWRGSLGYRYLQRDAVLDAFNDEDFHLGGTDTKGYLATFDYALNPRVWLRLKYMSANAIDGPPLGIDVLQIDLNTQF
jgi:Putative porin